jgi:antitoxin component YwqK of YwqJK toxin-antitoxin module
LAVVGCVLAALCLVGVAAFNRHRITDWFKTSYSELSYSGARLVGSEGEPFSGTLVARDQEIALIAEKVLAGTPLQRQIVDEKLTGIILEVETKGGLLDGPAALYVDLRSEISLPVEGGGANYLLAYGFFPRIQVGEARFASGKLEGRAALWMPSPTLERVKLGEAHFKNSLLDGVVRIYHEGGEAVRSETTFVAGVPSGPARAFFPGGQVSDEWVHAGGLEDGERREFYADGKRRSQSRTSRGEPVGKQQIWFPTGQLQAEIEYESGEERSRREWYSNGAPRIDTTSGESSELPPDGTIREYYRSGRLRTVTTYAHGVKAGPYQVFYEDGRKWEEGVHADGQVQGKHTKWWKSGKLALDETLVQGHPQGSYKRWYDDGKPWEEASYTSGRLHGRYRKWWKNGALAHDYVYEDGRIHGAYRTWYDSGAVWAVGEYAHGVPVGTLKRWFPDGKLGFEQSFKDGRPEGSVKRWYANGRVRLEATYVGGKLHGEFKNWLEDGTVYEMATFDRGTKITSSLQR